MRHYVVTGGAGFIGSSLIKQLLAADNDVRITAVENFDPFYSRQLKELNISGFARDPRFTLQVADLAVETPKSLAEKITVPVDVIVHLAAKAGVRPSILDPLAYQRANVLGLQNMLDFAVQADCSQFVFASSSSVYGVNDHFPWKEDERLMPVSPYAMTKLAGEMLGHVYNRLYKTRFIALRFFTVYGPGQRPDLAIHKFTKRILEGRPLPVFGDGSTSRDYTYIDDTVQGIVAAMSYRESGFEIINLGNNYAVPLKQLIEALEKTIGRKASIEQLPEQPGDVPKTYADISKARKLLGYSPSTSLEVGLENFYQWFSQHRQLLMAD